MLNSCEIQVESEKDGVEIVSGVKIVSESLGGHGDCARVGIRKGCEALKWGEQLGNCCRNLLHREVGLG